MGKFKKIPQSKVTWAQAARDILIVSMNKGQLPLLGIIAILFLLIWKMPDERAAHLLFDLVDKLANWEMWAYILLGIVLIAWFIHARVMRKEFSNECRRIGQEKSKLQKQLAEIEFKSSDQL